MPAKDVPLETFTTVRVEQNFKVVANCWKTQYVILTLHNSSRHYTLGTI